MNQKIEIDKMETERAKNAHVKANKKSQKIVESMKYQNSPIEDMNMDVHERLFTHSIIDKSKVSQSIDKFKRDNDSSRS